MDNKWDNVGSYLLKECYELAAEYETSDIAKDVLRARAKGVELPDNYIPVQSPSHLQTPQQIVSTALYELSAGGSSGNYSYAISALSSLPTSAEKEFVLALAALRSGTNETQRIEALRHITIALSYSPNDPRILALANILKAYEP